MPKPLTAALALDAADLRLGSLSNFSLADLLGKVEARAAGQHQKRK